MYLLSKLSVVQDVKLSFAESVPLLWLVPVQSQVGSAVRCGPPPFKPVSFSRARRQRSADRDLSSFPLHLSLLFVLVSIDEQQPLRSLLKRN